MSFSPYKHQNPESCSSADTVYGDGGWMVGIDPKVFFNVIYCMYALPPFFLHGTDLEFLKKKSLIHAVPEPPDPT